MKNLVTIIAVSLLLCACKPAVSDKNAAEEVQKLTQETVELFRAGNRDGAVATAKKALDLAEKKFGPEHPDVASTLNNLALLYGAQGQYAQAEPLLKRSLGILEKALGPEHPQVAQSLNNLAQTYSKLGQFAQAEPLYKRSLAIAEKALGPNHPDVATSIENLAGLYRATKRDGEAAELEKRVQQIRSTVKK